MSGIFSGRAKLPLLLLTLLLGISGLFVTSCVLSPKDDPGKPPPPDPDLNRDSVANLLEHWLQDAYSRMDSTRYEAALDDAYLFELIEGEIIDPDLPNPWWDKTEELTIAGKMFGARYGDGNVKVKSIVLNISPKTTVVDATNYDGKPEGETWYKATVAVDLRVVADDPAAEDGSGITNFVVNSDQIFVCRPDPDSAGTWVIYKQTDQAPIN